MKAAIILLGLQLSVQQVIEVGAVGLGIVTATLVSTFVFTCWLGKRLGVGKKLTPKRLRQGHQSAAFRR